MDMQELACVVRQAAAARAAQGRERTEHARAALASIRAKKRTSNDAVQLACFACPGVAGILNVKALTVAAAPIHSLFRLALSPRVCGSSIDAHRIYEAQQFGLALVAKTALLRQEAGLLQWIAPPSQHGRGDQSILGHVG